MCIQHKRKINQLCDHTVWMSGIACGSNALIELEGSQTKVDGNGTRGFSYNYGLNT